MVYPDELNSPAGVGPKWHQSLCVSLGGLLVLSVLRGKEKVEALFLCTSLL